MEAIFTIPNTNLPAGQSFFTPNSFRGQLKSKISDTGQMVVRRHSLLTPQYANHIKSATDCSVFWNGAVCKVSAKHFNCYLTVGCCGF
jgi:hypothetical protein